MANKFLSRTASYLVLKNNDEYLLARRCNTGFEDGNYSLVAGHVEQGESFTDALIREVKEEANIDIAPNDATLIHVMHRVLGDLSYVDSFFLVEDYHGELKNLEKHKCDDFSWYSLADLPDNTVDYVRQALAAIAKGEHYSEYRI